LPKEILPHEARPLLLQARPLLLIVLFHEIAGLVTELLFPFAKWSQLLRLRKEKIMLWTIFVVLLILWLLGMVSSYTLGGFIHILLVIAIAVLLINIISGRRAV